MHFSTEDVTRHGAADQRGGDVVEEAREHGDDHEQREAALPVVRKKRGHLVRDAALFEMPREQRKSHQQQEQVREDDPLVLHVQREAGEPGAGLEARERELVERDRRKAGSATASV